ncbi:Ribosomal protein L13 domain-containing protein [Cynara cardunculus var. scolymus]|uniref:Ribosomal protein L13 domain-containing protein n=1 Tax=Cynara cardunculus var. scolymus TaxID=59895 RepID=A0A103XMY9_CYNCS|nr:Ribosomal protein L13 domain-containing protein [Cynara cardunculus var. scolymus]
MVSGSGIYAQEVVVDARHHMLGRLSSILGKELLNEQIFTVAKRQAEKKRDKEAKATTLEAERATKESDVADR